MTHHVLELYDCFDASSWRRVFDRNDVHPQFSRHGEDRSVLCITWNSGEVEIFAILDLVGGALRELKTQSTLYTDVIEPPYRMQPQLLDHGTVVRQWWRGCVRHPLRWPAGEQLPEPVRQAVVRLKVAGQVWGWPAVVPNERGGTLRFSVRPSWRTRTLEDAVCDTLEGLSTPEYAVCVVYVEEQTPYFPRVKPPTAPEQES